MKTTVWISTSFIHKHRWPGAPDWCAYLRNLHRHVFHVKMYWQVGHNDRDIEFIQMKKDVDRWLKDSDWEVTASCEQIAMRMMPVFGCCRVSVSEDGENGAEVTE